MIDGVLEVERIAMHSNVLHARVVSVLYMRMRGHAFAAGVCVVLLLRRWLLRFMASAGVLFER